MSLPVQVSSENLGVLVDAPILYDRAIFLEQIVMLSQAPRKEKHLGMKAPTAHIVVKIGQIRIFGYCFIDRLPAEAFSQQSGQGRLPHPDISGNGDEIIGHIPPSRTDRVNKINSLEAKPSVDPKGYMKIVS
jgi:hypothetical protein